MMSPMSSTPDPKRVPLPLDPRTRRIAWIVAIVADAIQWLALPAFIEGAASPVNDVLDVVVAIVLIRLLGWHWAFAPSVIAELVPGLNLVPTWTASVWLATRGRKELT